MGDEADHEQELLLRPGAWLWATRAGAERDLCEELEGLGVRARQLDEGLVLSEEPPTGAEPAFARQGLPIAAVTEATAEALYPALKEALRPKKKITRPGRKPREAPGAIPQAPRPFALQVFSPDSEAGNRLSGTARALQEALSARAAEDGYEVLDGGSAAKDAGALLVQACLLPGGRAAIGAMQAVAAHSLAPGGRLRTKNTAEAPSRSAMKLAEALLWLGRGPEPEDLCVDLGAAPGGWTRVLIDRGARVIAVDPGLLAPPLRGHRRVEHVHGSAFTYEPDEPADWLLCDMAWRPLEVAALLAKWGRKHWARFLVANIKLPMKQRAAMLARVREILATGGWVNVRARQLYHDRDEVTLAAWRGFGVDARPPRGATPGAGKAARPAARPAGEQAARARPGKPGARPSAPGGTGGKLGARPFAPGAPGAKGARPATGPARSKPGARPFTPGKLGARSAGGSVGGKPARALASGKPGARPLASGKPGARAFAPGKPGARPSGKAGRPGRPGASRPGAGGSRPPGGRPSGGRSGRRG